MTEAFNNATLRVKKEYSGLRRSGLKSVRELKDTDQEYEKEVDSNTTVNSGTLSSESNKDTNTNKSLHEIITEKAVMFDEALPQVLDDCKLFKVTITPGRKPRKRDISRDFIVIPAKSIEDAENKIIQGFSNKGASLKRKWISVIPTSMEELAKSGKLVDCIENISIIDELNKVVSSDDEEPCIEDIVKNKRNSDLVSPLEGGIIGNLKDASNAVSTLDENGYIVELQPNFIALSVTKPIDYIITIVPNFGPHYPPIKTKAKSIGNAIAYILTALKHDRLKNKYPDINYFNVLNVETGKIIQVDFKCIREVSKDEE